MNILTWLFGSPSDVGSYIDDESDMLWRYPLRLRNVRGDRLTPSVRVGVTGGFHRCMVFEGFLQPGELPLEHDCDLPFEV